jgi:hypothetical protein
MSLWLTVLSLPLIKIATWVAVSILRLLVALYALLVVCLLTYALLSTVSIELNIPMPWLSEILRLVRNLSINLSNIL